MCKKTVSMTDVKEEELPLNAKEDEKRIMDYTRVYMMRSDYSKWKFDALIIGKRQSVSI